jgi:hypothetical protein
MSTVAVTRTTLVIRHDYTHLRLLFGDSDRDFRATGALVMSGHDGLTVSGIHYPLKRVVEEGLRETYAGRLAAARDYVAKISALLGEPVLLHFQREAGKPLEVVTIANLHSPYGPDHGGARKINGRVVYNSKLEEANPFVQRAIPHLDRVGRELPSIFPDQFELTPRRAKR